MPIELCYMLHVEQELLTLSEHLSSPPVFSGVRVAGSLVFCVVFYRLLLALFLSPLDCLSFIWLPFCYLQTLLRQAMGQTIIGTISIMFCFFIVLSILMFNWFVMLWVCNFGYKSHYFVPLSNVSYKRTIFSFNISPTTK